MLDIGPSGRLYNQQLAIPVPTRLGVVNPRFVVHLQLHSSRPGSFLHGSREHPCMVYDISCLWFALFS